MGLRFLLVGVDVGGNYGCDGIVMGTERILHHQFPDSEVWLPATGCRRRDYNSILGVRSGIVVKDDSAGSRFARSTRRICEKAGVLRPEIVRARTSLVRQADCVLSIGGDLYTFADNEANWPFPWPIVEAGNKVIGQGKPYVVWCASVGPFERAGSRLHELSKHLKACRAIIVREHASFVYLRETLGLRDNVYLAADPAFLMEPEPFEGPFLNDRNAGKLLAINFSIAPLQHVYGGVGVQEVQRTLVQILRELLGHLSIRLLFVPHVGSDYEFMSPICRAITEHYPKQAWILPRNIGARKTKWAVSQAQALLTMRFHCALAGFSTSTPTVILVSTAKGEKMCREMYGDLEYALPIRDMSTETMAAKVMRLFDEQEEIRTRLKVLSQQMKERALSAGAILAGVL